jgi:hypothetical protein
MLCLAADLSMVAAFTIVGCIQAAEYGHTLEHEGITQ